jgi:glycosyl transferase family 25
MKILVINLQRSHQRRHFMKSQLDRVGADYEIVEAVDGYELTDEEIQTLCEEAALGTDPNWLSKGAIGCALSHRKALEKVEADNVQAATILEDDVIIPDDLPDILRRLEDKGLRDEVVMLHWSSWIDQPFTRESAEEIGKGFVLASPTTVNQLRGTAGYVITFDAAHKITQANRPVRATSDSWDYFAAARCFIRLRCLVPPVIGLTYARSEMRRNSQSVINNIKRYLEDNIRLIQQISVSRRRKLFSRYTRYHFVD